MPVYVDDAQIPYGRMKMCHVLADTHDELMAMMKTIGIAAKHIEAEGEVNEHFNISQAYRTKAIKAGAIEVSSRELVKLIRRKRAAADSPQAENAFGWEDAPEIPADAYDEPEYEEACPAEEWVEPSFEDAGYEGEDTETQPDEGLPEDE